MLQHIIRFHVWSGRHSGCMLLQRSMQNTGKFPHTRTTRITVTWHSSTFWVNTRYRHGVIIPIALHWVCSSLAPDSNRRRRECTCKSQLIYPNSYGALRFNTLNHYWPQFMGNCGQAKFQTQIFGLAIYHGFLYNSIGQGPREARKCVYDVYTLYVNRITCTYNVYTCITSVLAMYI